MPALLTVASTLMCPHGGVVTATPASSHATAGAPILSGADTFVIAGCAFAPGGVPSPCVSVNWVQTVTKVKHGGNLALSEASVGLCLAGTQAPQGTVLINAPGQASVNGL
jgi:hypothetical protein